MPRVKASPLRKQVRAKIVDSILDATEEVAIEAGIGGLTVGAIAAKAGVAVGTLYNYYVNTDAIIAALFKARTAEMLPEIAAIGTSTATLAFEPRLRSVVGQLCTTYEAHARFLRVAVQVDRIGNKMKPRDTTLVAATASVLLAVMKQGAKQKQFTAARAEPYARMLHGSLRAMFVWRLTESSVAPVRADLLVDTFLHG
ncbi:MAG TPA: TetR/AcrR family transcriptional regulator, partial [Kofleriaceae bacterium]